MTIFNEDIDFQDYSVEEKTKWINSIISNYSKIPGELTYIFCSDDYLLNLNIEHLNHDTLTDIITFDYTKTGIISGDIFISIDRIEENAKKFQVTFQEELNRVMAHGILHLIGFKDKTDEEKKEMRQAENLALEILK
ncbi:rRNA maturation RNase YbeY [Flavobacteriales bacterium]|nr:rRNA maturation RNase YbeY [Flavobacteriales bacterium]MDA9262311.1 rRNA maturation RNase YbeY [bacterium]MDB4089002.1 rRNA maturation RNase YbeY [Flavobacteriales bacterium]